MPSAPVIRVLIADDRLVVRRGLEQLFATVPDFEVVGVACDGEQAVAQARALGPDVLVMDLVMPKLDGVEAIRQVIAARPETRIVVLTAYGEGDRIERALQAGARRCLLKHTDSDDVVLAVRRAYEGPRPQVQ